MRLLGALLAGAGLLAPSAAFASCVSGMCFCTSGPRGTVEAEIQAIDGPRTSFLVSAPRGDARGLDAGDVLVLPRTSDDAVGTRWMLELPGPSSWERYRIDADGGVTCATSAPPLVVPVTTAEDLVSSDDCPAQMQALGFREPPCNDVRRWPGCSAGGPVSASAFFALLLLARMRRRLRPGC